MIDSAPATLELTLQSTTTSDSYRLVAQYSPPGHPRIQRERIVSLDSEELLALEGAKEYGIQLGKLVFAEGIRELFAQARSASSALRVLLGIEARQLQTLRWERLCAPIDEDRWEFLGTFQDAPFSLYLPSTTDRRFPPFTREELKVLVVIASPPPGENRYKLAPFDVADALQRVTAGLGDIPFDLLADQLPPDQNLKVPLAPPTLRALCEQLTKGRYPILHIVCHGIYKESTGGSAIFLQSDDGGIEAVRASQLIDELSKLSSSRGLPHFAFLAVCDSAAPEAEKAMGGLGQRLVRELGMPAVLAMTEKVSQTTALELSRAFYPRLLAHGFVDLALAEACVRVAGRHDLLVPALFSRLGGRPLFVEASEGELRPQQLHKSVDRLRGLFVERAPVLLDLLDAQLRPALAPGFEQPRQELLRSAQQAFDQALWALEDLCEKVLEVPFQAFARDQQTPPLYEKECPFPGLRSFTQEQRRYFHGRDQLIRTLCERLRAHPFLAVLGSSGSGKSSLVMAGVIPALGPALQAIRMTPGHAPVEALAHAIAALGALPPNARPLLLVDQFEELFTLCHSEAQRQAFIEQLLGCVGSLQVVLTIRADFLGECAQHPRLREAIQHHQELVGPLSADELRAAIEAQAQDAKLRFESGLSELILKDLADEPGAMPLLQHALREVWERRHGRWLRVQAYEEIGRVSGAIAKTADRLYESLSAEDKLRLQDVMTRLTAVGETTQSGERPRDTRQRLSLHKLCYTDADKGPVKALVAMLADQRLLVTSTAPKKDPREPDEQLVEVAHEALIRSWKRLQDWLDDQRQLLRLRQELDESAKGWRQNKGREEYLEHCGDRGAHIRAWVKDQKLKLDPEQAEYFAACEEKDQRAVRQARIRNGILGGLTIMALVAAILSLTLYRETVKARDTTREALKMAYIRGYTVTDPTRAALMLSEIKDPEHTAGWHQAAFDMLSRSLTRHTIGEAKTTVAGLSTDGKHAVLVKSIPGVVKGWQTQVWNLDGSGRFLELNDSISPCFNCVAFSSDGHRMLQAGKVWELDRSGSARIVKVLEGDIDWFEYRALSPDGLKVVVVSRHKSALVWDLDGSDRFLDLKGHQGRLNTVAFSPDGKQIVTASDDMTARVWTLTDPDRPLELKGCEHRVRYAFFSPDGKQVVMDCRGKVWVWTLTNAPSSLELGGLAIHPRFAVFSPDGTEVVAVERTIRVWKLSDPDHPYELQGHNDSILAAAISPDGKYLVTGSSDHTARMWDLRQKTFYREFKGHTGDVGMVRFSQDGKQVITGSHDGTVRVWDWSSPPVRKSLIGHGGSVRFAAFSPDSQRVVTASSDQTARVWTLTNPSHPIELKGHTSAVNSAMFSRDGQRVVTASDDSTARVWTLSDLGHPLPLTGHRGPVKFAAFGPDDTQVVTASRDTTARVWALANPSRPLELKGHTSPVDSAMFSRDGQRVFTSGSHLMLVFPLANPDQPLKFDDYELINSASLSPDGRRIVTAAIDNMAHIWTLPDMRSPILLAGHTAPLTSAVFSPDGRRVLTASHDRTARLWDLDSSGCVLELKRHSNSVLFAAFSPDGDQVVTASGDNTAILWTISAKRLLTLLREATTGCIPLEERVSFLAETPKEACRAFTQCEQMHRRATPDCSMASISPPKPSAAPSSPKPTTESASKPAPVAATAVPTVTPVRTTEVAAPQAKVAPPDMGSTTTIPITPPKESSDRDLTHWYIDHAQAAIMRRAIVQVLARRFKQTPIWLLTKLDQIQSLEALSQLHEAALESKDLRAFQQRLGSAIEVRTTP